MDKKSVKLAGYSVDYLKKKCKLQIKVLQKLLKKYLKNMNNLSS
ncbi:hypothetical protein Q5M85_08810 [Paraclostridium bifermentans]|nr:hypothetical protein [Paraclostridium bifermentans]